MSRNPYDDLPQVPSFEVTSDDVAHDVTLGNAHVSGMLGAGGEDVSPHLTWSGAPAETKSYAVTVYDPDAPTASGFWHWAAFNIPASVTELASNASKDGMPAGTIQLKNDAGAVGYVGAAPPGGHGTHHYWTVVHAVDVEKLEVPAEGSNAFLGFNLFSHTLARAIIVPTYEVN